jgi:3-oxoacyl-[acyl-carrier protein] reductase
MQLKTKVIIITGASKGLGVAMAETCAREGAKVVLAARSADKLAALQRRITRRGGRALAVACDVGRLDDLRRLVATAVEKFGRIDGLINNAGVWPTALVKDLTEEAWDRTLAVNLKGAFLTCREAVRRWLRQQRGGRIVNVSSPAAFIGSTTGHADYAASKAGLISSIKR